MVVADVVLNVAVIVEGVAAIDLFSVAAIVVAICNAYFARSLHLKVFRNSSRRRNER